MRSLNDFLNASGVKVAAAPAAPATPAAPAAPAPAKTAVAAAPASAAPAKVAAGKATTTQPDAAPAGGHKGRAVSGESSNSPEGQDTGGAKHAAVQYDPAVIVTPEQKWLITQDIVCPDQVKAAALYQSMVKTAEAEKRAELEKVAEEYRYQGALQYQGMVKESTALSYAFGEIPMNQVVKLAAAIGVDPNGIFERAGQIKAATQMFEGQDAAQPNRVLTGNNPATPARPASANVTTAAEQSGNTINFEPEASAGTRKAVSGSDEKLVRMTDTFTLPGNPGLNHGQQVDQGKGYSK